MKNLILPILVTFILCLVVEGRSFGNLNEFQNALSNMFNRSSLPAGWQFPWRMNRQKPPKSSENDESNECDDDNTSTIASSEPSSSPADPTSSNPGTPDSSSTGPTSTAS
uniref:Uncharacterized protein n=1 Tax=Globodera rostochiensis TaxID=31243 RepID=A0A914IER5_GLORO